jgi:hypothetical protein
MQNPFTQEREKKSQKRKKKGRINLTRGRKEVCRSGMPSHNPIQSLAGVSRYLQRVGRHQLSAIK